MNKFWAKNTFIFSFIFSLLYSIFFSLGNAMYLSGTTKSFSDNIFPNLLNFLLCFIIALIISTLACSIELSPQKGMYLFDRFNYKPYLFLLGLFFVICWIPAYRSYFPGMVTYDLSNQMCQMPDQYTTHHPPLHTFLLQIFMSLFDSDIDRALPVFDFCQMIFLSYVFCCTASYFISHKAPVWLIVISIIFYALNPVLAIFVSIPVKDVLFGGILVLFLLKFRDILYDTNTFLADKKNIFSYIILGLLFCLLRNNAVYVLIVLVPFIFLLTRKKNMIISIVFIIPIFLFLFTSTVIYKALGIGKGSFVEFLSVPLQQISRVVVEDESSISINEKQAISSFLEYDKIENTYNRRLADPIKAIFDGSHGVKPVFTTWLNMLNKNLSKYIDAFLDLNIPYWYVKASGQDPVSGVPYIESNFIEHWELVESDTMMFKVVSFYESVADYSLFENIPFFINIFSLAFPLWFILFILFDQLSKKRADNIFCILIPFLFLCTYFLGPVNNCRYIIPIVMVYPILFYFYIESHIVD